MKNVGYKILVVEDDGALLNLLVDHLAAMNYKVLKAADGQQALDLLFDNEVDLILLDLLLPKLDGYKVLERIRKYPEPKIAAIPVIVLSNLWSDKDILAAKTLKVEEYYVKAHTNLEDVYKKVSEIAAQKKAAA